MSSTKKKKRNRIFPKIERREHALKMIDDGSITFIVVAIIQGFASFFLSPSLLLDAAIFFGLGVALRYLKSRIIAIILLFFSGIMVITTLFNRIDDTPIGGTNIFLAGMIFWTAVKCVEATFKLHGKFADDPDEDVFDSTIDAYFDTPSYEEPLESDHKELLFTKVEWALIAILVLFVVLIGFVVLML